MKELFLKHYLPVLLFVLGSLLIGLLPVLLTSKIKGDILVLGIVILLLAFFLTLIIGFIKHKYEERIIVKRQRKQLKKDLFQQLLDSGFINNEVSVLGYFQNYYTIISAERGFLDGKKWIEIIMLFDPKQQQQYIPKYIYEKLYEIDLKGCDYSWNSNCLTIRKVYGIKMPKYDVIITVLEKATKIFQQYNIGSITKENWDLSIEGSINHYNKSKY